MSFELDVWREACRHIEMEELLERLLPLLRRHLSLEGLAVRRIDVTRGRVETIGVQGDVGATVSRTPIELTPEELAQVLTTCRAREPFTSEIDLQDPTFGRRSPTGRALIVPLSREDEEPLGLLALVGPTAAPFGAEHLALARVLVEPFAVALANDLRVHELARLREAMEAENRALLTRLQRQSIIESIVGATGGLAALMQRVEQVARTDVPVLLLGETGSGKEVIARAIHERSPRRRGPMVRVNCGAIPTDLVDSELFGHERGSFTGAVGTRKGWFERADGGTLLLDEIGELPAAAQVRLLRVLQEGTLERVGGQRTIPVDVRIVAATHRDLHQMVGEGAFREDLWYRLSVFPLRLPALRERLEDLPALAAHFAARAGERLGGAPLVPSGRDLDLLLGYPWPGNVRELAAVIERAAILGHGKRLDVAAALGASPPPTRSTAPVKSELTEPSRPVDPSPLAGADAAPSLEAVVRAHIEAALAAARGRIEGPRGAAAALGVNPHTLRARMRKLGVDWARYRSERA